MIKIIKTLKNVQIFYIKHMSNKNYKHAQISK